MKSSIRRLAAIAALALSAAVPAHATVVFSDNFDANATGLNVVPAAWSVSAGTVDVIGPGFFDLIPGSGNYIDLDGSTGQAGVLSKSFTGLANGLYQVTFDLAGNHRSGNDTVVVGFGGSSQTVSLGINQGWTTLSMLATVTNGTLTLSFDDLGGDNMGALLDRVSVSAVPEPGTPAMLLAGLAVLGGVLRRRRTD